jgi:hypothetical protein
MNAPCSCRESLLLKQEEAMSTKHNSSVIEKAPRDTLSGITSNAWKAIHQWSIPYSPKDKPVQEDWQSIARKFGIGVQELIYFNFMTNNPDEVNYYLRVLVGCKKISPSGNNWMFHNNCYPGIIYIPPPETREFNFEPDRMCVWLQKDAKDFIMRLVAVAQTIDGEAGKRIRKMVRVILTVGYPACKELWYYSTKNIKEFVDWQTGNARRKKMTKDTGDRYPFDGTDGQFHEPWRVHIVRDLFDKFGCGQWDPAQLKTWLIGIDSRVFNGWKEMTATDFKTHTGGGDAYDVAIENFIGHVDYLSKQKTHLYWAFGS